MAPPIKSFASSDRFLAELRTPNLKPGYVLLGDEAFLYQRCRAGILSALLDPAQVDRALLIFVEVVLDRTTGEAFADFAAAIARAPEILECHMVAGGFDYLIKARVKDMEAYRAFLGDILVEMPGVRETRTYAVLEEVKNTVRLAI